jgi:hypothetical protein
MTYHATGLQAPSHGHPLDEALDLYAFDAAEDDYLDRQLFALRASLAEFACDPDDARELIRTTPLRFDRDGLPVAYMAEQLFGLEAAHLGGRFL